MKLKESQSSGSYDYSREWKRKEQNYEEEIYQLKFELKQKNVECVTKENKINELNESFKIQIEALKESQHKDL